MAVIHGTDGPETLVGSVEDDEILGFGGDDLIDGSEGVDWLDGGDGDDTIHGGAGSEAATILGGAGDDHLDSNGGGGILDGGLGNDTIYGGEGGTSYGGDGDDWMSFGNQHRAYGGAGSDFLQDATPGRGESTFLHGGLDADTIWGGGGADSIIGAAGADVLRGGGSRDKFIYQRPNDSTVWHRDVIEDWQNDLDVLDLRRIDADKTAAGDQAFTIVEANAPHAPGTLWWRHEGGNTILSAEIDGDRQIDFQIRINGIHDLSEAEIWL